MFGGRGEHVCKLIGRRQARLEMGTVHTQTEQPGRMGVSVGAMGLGWGETAGCDSKPCELMSLEIWSDETCSFFGTDYDFRLNLQSEDFGLLLKLSHFREVRSTTEGPVLDRGSRQGIHQS